MKIIAHTHSDFKEKFGIPRQSGLVPSLLSKIIFEPEYANPSALEGLEEFSHIWLIWQFSEAAREDWSPTVRPPRLGGNTRMGVFATRSPFRPNPIGLSCVKLEKIDWEGRCLEEEGGKKAAGPVLIVSGADLMDGTPIYDIKPYIAYADSHPEAVCSFADRTAKKTLQVILPDQWKMALPEEKRETVKAVLAQDPRPSYQKDPSRIYGMAFAGWNIRFRVEGDVLTVVEVGAVT